MAKIFHKLVSLDEAKQIVSDEAKKFLRIEEIGIEESLHRISSESIFANHDIPPFDRSEVDGFAVDHKDVEDAEEDNPVTLEIIGSMAAGEGKVPSVPQGKAIQISTGAVIPRGADSVVMVEDTKRNDNKITIYRSTIPGENISYSGSDFFIGETLLSESSVLTSEKIALLSAAGLGKIKVYSKFKIGVFSTGDELKRPGEELVLGEVFDTNANYFVAELLSSHIAEVTNLGIIRDNDEEMENFLKENINKYDIMIGSGSTSAGFHDMLYRVIEDVGGELLFHGISVKPGKPTFFARTKHSLFIGMPGFPLSSAAIFKCMIIPALKQAYSIDDIQMEHLPIPFKMNGVKGKDVLLPAILTRKGYVYPIFGPSGSISRLAYADGFMVLSKDYNYFEAGEKVPFIKNLGRFGDSIISIGSNDPLLERIILSVDKSAKIINDGSWGGVGAIKRGESDISGIHIMKDGQYNSFVMDEKMKSNSVLVSGFVRRQGFVSKKEISGFKEIVDNSLLFVNRNKGSGTRALIDEMIEAEFPNKNHKQLIKGYMWEVKTHAGVARAVHQGRADVGITLEYFALNLGLKFTPVKVEHYDILLSRDFYDSDKGKKFISALKQSKNLLSDFPGYETSPNAGDPVE